MNVHVKAQQAQQATANMSPEVAALAQPLRTVSMIQGIIYLITGIWPLVHMKSFVKITGPKTDYWLVKTVGLLITVVGAVLTLAAWQRRVSSLIALLATASAAALTAVDVVYVLKGRIRPVYLLDALLESGLIGAWFWAREHEDMQ